MALKNRTKWIIAGIFSLALVSFILLMFMWMDISPEDIIWRMSDKITNSSNIVVLSQEDNNILSSRYKSDRKEFVYCLNGKIEGEEIIVRRLREANVIESEEDSVAYETCGGANLLGTIHSHPTGSCELSRQDAFTFGSQGNKITAVICGPGDYGFYVQNNFEEQLNVKVR